MYSTFRRSILRSRRILLPPNARISNRQSPSFLKQSLANQRTFSVSTRRWKHTEPDLDEHSTASPSHDTSKVSEHTLPESVVVAEQDAELEAAALEDELAHKAGAKTQPQILADKIESVVDLVADNFPLQEALEATGLELSDIPEELRPTLLQSDELLEQDAKLDQLAEGFAISGMDDFQKVLKESGMTEADLLKPLTKRERQLLRESGIEPNDPDAMEEAAYKAFGAEEEDMVEDEFDEDRDMSLLNEEYFTTPHKVNVFDPVGRTHHTDVYQTEDAPENEQITRTPLGFWNEDKDEDLGEDEEFNQDDLPTQGHIDLDLQREIREYARLMVWEMPLLSKLARPYNPPTEDQVLRFRYTTYMGEDHPAEKKVVVSFSPSAKALDLTQVQRNKLIKVAGARYNPSTDTIKMSCESFETAAQNKRYLGDQVEMLLKEAKDASDTFEDIPFDFRHHNPKKKYEFPVDWIVTSEKRQKILAERKAAQLPVPSEQTVSVEAKQAVAVAVAVDGLLHTHDGAVQRMREDRLKQMIINEDQDIKDTRTRKERRALLINRSAERKVAEQKAMTVDSLARRKSKRPWKVELPTERLLKEEGLRQSRSNV